jgi:hypothetical protein
VFCSQGACGGYALTPELDMLVLYDSNSQEPDANHRFKKSYQTGTSSSVNNKKNKKMTSDWSEVSSLKHKRTIGGRVPGTAPMVTSSL